MKLNRSFATGIAVGVAFVGISIPATAAEDPGQPVVKTVVKTVNQPVNTGFGKSTTVKITFKAKVKTYPDGTVRKYVSKVTVTAPKKIDGVTNANRTKIRKVKDLTVGVKNVVEFDPPRPNYFWHDSLALGKNAVTDGRLVCAPGQACLVFFSGIIDVKGWEDLTLNVRTSL